MTTPHRYPTPLATEQSLVGSILLNHEWADRLDDLMPSEVVFHDQRHATIVRSIRSLRREAKTSDNNTLVSYMETAGTLEKIGGMAYLEELVTCVPSPVNAEYYAKIVYSAWRARVIIDAANDTAFRVGEAWSEVADITEIADAASAAMSEAVKVSANTADAALADVLADELDRIGASDGEPNGLKTGFTKYDAMTGGLLPGEMIIVAARPSLGKTAWMLTCAVQVAFGGRPPSSLAKPSIPFGVFSLEMSKASLARRLVTMATKIPTTMLHGGRFGDEAYKRLVLETDRLAALNARVIDMPGMTVAQIRTCSRRMVEVHNVRAIFIDYLQLIGTYGRARENRQVEVSEISRGLKALSRELNVPVVVLAQLNRAVEQREGNRPRMSDLRESGSLEQDADVVLLLHREAYFHAGDENWLDDNRDKLNLAELIVAKQRNGPTGSVPMVWDGHAMTFHTFDDGDDEHASDTGGAPV